MRGWVFLVLVQGVFGPPPVKRPEGAGERLYDEIDCSIWVM